MILIPCPCCGPRDESEFIYGGPRRPSPALTGYTGTDDWYDAVYRSANPSGPLVELWYHTSGCETWIEVTRDTTTHDVTDCSLPRRREGDP